MNKLFKAKQHFICAIDLCLFTTLSGSLENNTTERVLSRKLNDFSPKGKKTSNTEIVVKGLLIRGNFHTSFSGDCPVVYGHHQKGTPQYIEEALLKIFGAMVCVASGHRQVQLQCLKWEREQIGYAEPIITWQDVFSREYLIDLLEKLVSRYLTWLTLEASHRNKRDQILSSIEFPHQSPRPYQDLLMDHVYNALHGQQQLILEAPTGIGKTLGVLYPAITSMPALNIDKLLLLTTRRTGRKIFLDALRQVLKPNDTNINLRILVLSSKAELCRHTQVGFCQGCTSFYDKLPTARLAGINAGWLDHEFLQQIAQKHDICAYHFAIDMAKYADVIIADVNHFFSNNAVLDEYAQRFQWRYCLVVDEAHNLIQRVRDMYSISLCKNDFHINSQNIEPHITSALGKATAQWNKLDGYIKARFTPLSSTSTYPIGRLPDEFMGFIQSTIEILTRYQIQQGASDADITSLIMTCRRFLDLYGTLSNGASEHSFLSYTSARADDVDSAFAQLTIQNVCCSVHIHDRLQRSYNTIFFSATLQPPSMIPDILGLQSNYVFQSIPSPFSKSQVELRLVDIDCRYKSRDQTMPAVIDRIYNQYQHINGNYMVFVNSFDQLEKLSKMFIDAFPDVPVITQPLAMTESQSRDIIYSFKKQRGLVGFGLLGGGLAEGVSFDGESLIGVFVVGIGHPAVSPRNILTQRMVDQVYGHNKGTLYTFKAPAAQKIVQAVGRLIRDTDETGVIVLIDSRYLEQDFTRNLQCWWFTPPSSIGG